MTRQSNPALQIGLAVGGVAALLFFGTVVVVGFVVLAGRDRGTDGGGVAVAKAGDQRAVYSRDEFRKLVMGKTPDEVIAAVGRPSQTMGSEPDLTNWIYSNRTVDTITGRKDKLIQVLFTKGRVSNIIF